MAIVDVMIHIAEKTTAEARQQLEGGLRHTTGMAGAKFGQSTPQLMIVSDDPARMAASAVLASVVAAGYDARLVGL